MAPPKEDRRTADAREPDVEAGDLPRCEQDAQLPSLTDRELDILRLAAGGMTGRMIGEELLISNLTVKAHFENIRRKLGVSAAPPPLPTCSARA